VLVLPGQHRDQEAIVGVLGADPVDRCHIGAADGVSGIPERRIHLAAYPDHHRQRQRVIAARRQHGFANQPAGGPSAGQAKSSPSETAIYRRIDAPDHVSTKRRASTIVVERSFRNVSRRRAVWKRPSTRGLASHTRTSSASNGSLVMTTASTPARSSTRVTWSVSLRPRKKCARLPQIRATRDRARAPRTPAIHAARGFRTAAYVRTKSVSRSDSAWAGFARRWYSPGAGCRPHQFGDQVVVGEQVVDAPVRQVAERGGKQVRVHVEDRVSSTIFVVVEEDLRRIAQHKALEFRWFQPRRNGSRSSAGFRPAVVSARAAPNLDGPDLIVWIRPELPVQLCVAGKLVTISPHAKPGPSGTRIAPFSYSNFPPTMMSSRR